MGKSARLNFGIPDSEYIVQVDDTGAATSCYNQDTQTEYVGGGGGGDFYLVDISLTGDTDDIVGILYGALIDYPSESYPYELPSAPFAFADTLSVLTYQGNAILMFNDIFDSGNQSIKSNFTFSTTGDITYDEGDDAFIISGTGSIHFTLK